MELVHASFLWIANLAQPDIPLLIIYGISMFLSFRLSSTPPTDEQQKMMQNMMAFMFPVFFPFVLKSYPSAFTMYWMTFNLVSTIFQWRMMKASDPNKSIIKSLMGTSEIAATEAVPDRPGKNDSKKSDAKKEARTEEKKPQPKASETVPPRSKPRADVNGLNGTSHNGTLNGSSNGSDGEVKDVRLENGVASGQDKSPSGSSQSNANRNNSQRARRRRRY